MQFKPSCAGLSRASTSHYCFKRTWMVGTSPAMTNGSPRPFSRDHLFQDLAADALVGQGSIAPPPAVLLHLRGRADKTFRNLGEIRLGIIQAEDQTPGPDPAQCEPFGSQIILQHPIVARRLGVMDHPDRRQIADLDRQ